MPSGLGRGELLDAEDLDLTVIVVEIAEDGVTSLTGVTFFMDGEEDTLSPFTFDCDAQSIDQDALESAHRLASSDVIAELDWLANDVSSGCQFSPALESVPNMLVHVSLQLEQ